MRARTLPLPSRALPAKCQQPGCTTPRRQQAREARHEHAAHTAPPRLLSSAARDALVDALNVPPALLPSPWPTGSSYTTHAVLVLDLTRTCDARESKARARKIPTATTDCQSIDAERDLARQRLEAAETLPAIARDRAPARACKPYDKRAMLRRSSGSCRHDIGEERPVSHLPQRE